MTQKRAEILLAAVIAARSSSFLFSKIGIGSLGIFNLISLRYIFAFGILAAIFHRQLHHIRLSTVIRSAVLGGFFFATLIFELKGLKYTDSSAMAFLESTAIAFVPVFYALMSRRLPKAASLVSSGIALAGIFCLTLKNGMMSFGPGEMFGIAAALAYTAYTLASAYISGGDDVLQVGILQNGFLGLFATTAAIMTESPRLPGSTQEWICVLGLAIVCSAFGLTLQPVAQSGTTPERAGLFIAIAPVSSAILGSLILGEQLGLTGLLGGALIMVSIFIPKMGKLIDRFGIHMPTASGRLQPVSVTARNVPAGNCR